MPGIKMQEVVAILNEWFQIVEKKGDPQKRKDLYLHPDPRFIMPDGSSMDMTDHYKMHLQWCDEKHQCGQLYLKTLSQDPDRVQVTGTVYWEARYKDAKDRATIKTVVVKNVIIERIPNGSLRFVLHQNTLFHPLLDSAPMNMQPV